MTELTYAPSVHSAPPPYEAPHADVSADEKAPTPSLHSQEDEYEKTVCPNGHDTRLSPKCRAIRIGFTIVNPTIGLALVLCPKNRQRTCRACGATVMVSRKKVFC